MGMPENVVVMPAEQRAELKRLAEAATPGPWRVPAGTILVMSGPPLAEALEIASCETAIDAFANVDYIAALTPDVALATLAYVEAVETENGKLSAQLAEARQELADQERDALQWAKTLASYNNELSQLRAANEWLEYQLDLWERYSNRDTKGNVEEAMQDEPFVPKSPSPAPLEGEAGPAGDVMTGQRYRHYKGGEYVVVCVAKVEADIKQRVVVYQSADSPEMYTRPIEEFCAPRFVLCSGTRTSVLLVGEIEEGKLEFHAEDEEEPAHWCDGKCAICDCQWVEKGPNHG